MTEKSEVMLLQHEKNGEGREDTLNDGVAERCIIKEKDTRLRLKGKFRQLQTNEKYNK